MKPFLEKLQTPPDASWSMLNRRLDGGIPFEWHHHPEYELTLTLNSRGQRFIGDHVGDYDDGDLVLIGPNLPHTWASRGKVDPDGPHVALVLWFHPGWGERLTRNFVEFSRIADLLGRADRGLGFSAPMAAAVRGDIEALFARPAAERTIGLIALLDRLAGDQAATPLASAPPAPDLTSGGRDRIDRLLNHIHRHYARDIPLTELADVAALSLSGLHRLFVKHTRSSISDYVAALRIGEACSRLSASDQQIRSIAEAVGYETLSNFNRRFKALKGMTPRAYRALFRT